MAADPRHTTVTLVEREAATGLVPRQAYFLLVSGVTYTLGVGNKAGEAAAYLKDAGAGTVHTFDNDSAEDDRAAFLTGTVNVVI